CVVEGDQETPLDADRIRATGADAVQVNTGTGCHLDAGALGRALRALDPRPGSVVVVENVGNLVCPALFDLGEQARVVLTSVTEGEDKPLKYPHMYQVADLVLLNKVDLLPHLSYDVDGFIAATRWVNPTAGV
nr:hydrogenase nickel incorporation protein HypB [Micromonospora sp. DSM 115978]